MDLMGEEAAECQDSKERRLILVCPGSFEYWKRSYAPKMLKKVVESFHRRLATVVVISCCEGQVFVTMMLKEGVKTQMAVCHMEGWS